MAGTTFKKAKLVGESPTGIEDAIRTALETSAENVHGQTWCEVTDIRASLNGGKVDRWQVEVEVAFAVDG
jgi:flavin-binding protein dodecin